MGSYREIDPKDISPSFYNFIQAERSYVGQPDRPVILNRTLNKDWCVDPLHTDNLGRKPAHDGLVIAGASQTRVTPLGLQIESPKEWLQRLVQESEKRINVAFSAHEFCGKILIEGNVTSEQILASIERAWTEFQHAKQTLQTWSPADGNRLNLTKDIGRRGSAPVISYLESGRIRIVNQDYLITGIKKHPLGSEAIDRLESDQKRDLEDKGVLYSGS